MNQQILLSKILPNPEQPRSNFDLGDLQQLAASLKADGLLNPISVEGPHEDGIYFILDGERRWRAARLAGWEEIEVYIKPPLNGTAPQDRLMLAMIGNLQRSDMVPIEEARGFQKLREMGKTPEEIATRIGKSVSYIYSRLRLLEFPIVLQDAINQKRIPVSERVFGALRKLDPDQQKIIASKAAVQPMTEMKVLTVCSRVRKDNLANPKGRITISKESRCPAIDLNPGLPKYQAPLIKPLEDTCKKCGLFKDGDITLCKECPLTDFVRRLIC